MSLKQITDRIWVLPYDQRTDRPNLYYIRGDEGSLAVDAGASPAHVETFYAALQKQGLPLPDYTVITHWHWDHTFGLCAVRGETMATETTQQKLAQVMNWAWDRRAMMRREKTGEDIAFCNMHIMLEYGDPQQIRVVQAQTTLKEDLTLALGGVTAELLVRPSPHSEDSLVVYVPEEAALLVGDGDCEDLYQGQGMYEEAGLASWIDFLTGLEYLHHLNGHGDPMEKEGAVGYLQVQMEDCRREAEGRKLVRAYRNDYIRKLRRDVGHAPLMMAGCTVLLENEKGEILLQKRRDNGCWAPPGGAMEMGETAMEAARREAWEEAGVVVGEMQLLGVYTGEDRYIYYPNGDICYCTLIAFVSRDYVGDPMQDTDEALEHRFFARDQLPENLNRCDERSILDWAAGVTHVVCE